MNRLAIGTLLFAVACSGESNVTVTDFTLHECKGPETSGALETGRETADYTGLECVAWQLSDASTAIDLINFTEGCGFDGQESGETKWTPKLVQNDSELTVSVSWEFEGPSACGDCVHDFSIAAQAASLAHDKLALKLETRSCTSCPWAHQSLEIAKDQLKEGIRCRYVDWGLGFGRRDFLGKLGGPARDGACDAPLVPVEVESDVTLCLKACASNDDCQSSVSECKDGACQLTDPW